MAALQHRIQLRPYQAEDLPFLLSLYATTRGKELSQAPFTADQKTAFLQQQFSAQLHHYTHYYNTEQFFIVEWDQTPIGRLFVDQWTTEIRVVDISLLPAYQKQKIGSYLFEQLFTKARQQHIAVSIHVELYNPARLWYEKLGFKHKSTANEVYLLMEWQP